MRLLPGIHATAVVSWLALAATGCCSNPGSALARGIDEYDGGRYPDALITLGGLESRATELTPEQVARYTLYRGLSELALGNACAAHVWLGRAQRIAARAPAALDRSDWGRLRAAWKTLGKMPGETS